MSTAPKSANNSFANMKAKHNYSTINTLYTSNSCYQQHVWSQNKGSIIGFFLTAAYHSHGGKATGSVTKLEVFYSATILLFLSDQARCLASFCLARKGRRFCLPHMCLKLCWDFCDSMEKNKYVYRYSQNELYLLCLSFPQLRISDKILSINGDQSLLYGPLFI